MGWHKTLHPDMRSVRIFRPASAEQVLYRTIGHVCGKITQVLYSCLKNNEPYDPSNTRAKWE
jgi:hypothetical protein